MTTKSEIAEPTPAKSEDNSLSIVSLVLGLVSLTGPGLLFGIPAIILGATHPEELNSDDRQPIQEQRQERFDSSST